MEIRQARGELQRIRRSVSALEQRTFQTPLGRLAEFVECLFASDPPSSAAAIVEQCVFQPKHLEALLASHDLPLQLNPDRRIIAAEGVESSALLGALLADWLDFYFEPIPKRFVLYADHDEYTTLFAAKKGPLAQLAHRLTGKGFIEISGYLRKRIR
jgi:hypothetical protein